MSLRIQKKHYLRSVTSSYMDKVTSIISPPDNVPELIGYVMKIPSYFVDMDSSSIVINDGNEWDKKLRKRVYMFEREHKEKGRSFKRFRYSEEELIKLYDGDDVDKKIEARKSLFQSGPCKLVRVSYTEYDNFYGMRESIEWCIDLKPESKWVYPLDYDVWSDVGKHNKNGKKFKVLEEYQLDDISIIIKNKDKLIKLLENLEKLRNLCLRDTCAKASIRGSDGKFIETSSRSKILAFMAYDTVPSLILEDKREKAMLETLMSRLLCLNDEMENECRHVIAEYQKKYQMDIIKEIKTLIGVAIVDTPVK